MSVELIIGPPVQSMTRTAAEQALVRNPALPVGAEYTIAEHAGHWVAAFVDIEGLIKERKQAGEFPGEGGGPADASEEAPAPKSEGPDDSEPSEGGESDGGESKPPSSEGGEHKGEGGEHKEQGELAHLLTLIQAVADALGVSPDAGLGSPVPGADPMGAGGPPVPPAGPPGGHAGPPVPPPHGGPAGPGGPPGGPMGPGGNQHVMHEKSGPPMPPTFSSTHPWAHMVGKTSHFRVAEEIGEQDLAEVEGELQAIASAGGFRVVQARPELGEDGVKRFAAIIKTPSQS